MGNKINVAMMPDICQQIITKNDAKDLCVTTSVSRQFADEAKQWNKKQNIKIEVSKESQSNSSKYALDIHPQSIIAQSSCSKGYSMETEDSENDAVLSNDFIMRKLTKNKSHSRSTTFLEVPQSRTDTADLDSKTIEAIIDDLQTNNNTKKKMRTKSNSSSSTIKREFEKQLKQEQHEKDILKMENERLRKKIAALSMMKTLSTKSKSRSCSSNSDSGISKGSQHELSYRLVSPRSISSVTCAPTAFNWNISSNSSNHHLSPRYSPHSKIETSPHSTTCSSVIPDFEKDVSVNSVNQSFEKCESLSECPSIKRIIDALKWYRIYGDDHESVYKKMKKDDYGKQILDDYNHILEHHFDCDKHSGADVQNEYNLIFAEVNKHVRPCKFQHEKCAGYRRYLRTKSNRNLHKAQNQKQHELQMYVNTMDGIHCSFMHLGK